MAVCKNLIFSSKTATKNCKREIANVHLITFRKKGSHLEVAGSKPDDGSLVQLVGDS